MIRIRKASTEDLSAIRDLLTRSSLLREGVSENIERFLVAEEGGRVVATAGLEVGHRVALLRSVAVDPGRRGERLGVEIVRQTMRLASLLGAETVYLLTTTATEFFARLGFSPALRAEVDALFPDSAETRPGGCCASAQPMVLRDLSGILEPHARR